MDVPSKANRILNYILLAFLLIAIRVWFLAIIQHDEHVEIAKMPQRRTIVEKAPRGTIRDRFNAPLAVNRLHYEAGICYDLIREIPRVRWVNRTKTFPRKEYIEKLASLLAQKLNLNPTDIEDLIHSKASLFPNTPFVLKKQISEKTFFELKALTKDWPGLIAQWGSHRYYPGEKVGCQVLGRLGQIDHGSYHRIAAEIRELQSYLDERSEGKPVFLPDNYHSVGEVIDRLALLREKTYQFDDLMGKGGIERSFEERLRGRPGKNTYLVDPRGHLIHKLPGGKNVVPGQRLLLTISQEMQDLAEKLLAENERIRDQRFPLFSPKHNMLSPPWIKGGAIVVMEPKTGEILAFASHPRFNPNDFIEKKNIEKWLESKSYIGAIWDGRDCLERETFNFLKNEYEIETMPLTWHRYLDYTLGKNSTIRQAIDKVKTVEKGVEILQTFNLLLDLSEQSSAHALIRALYAKENSSPLEYSIKEALGQHHEHTKALMQRIEPYIKPILRLEDKLLFLDLLQLCVGHRPIPQLLQKCSLSEHREATRALATIRCYVKDQVRTLFERTDFIEWRITHFADYLKEKRSWEKEHKTYQRPYIEYLERAKRAQFAAFWHENQADIIRHYIGQTTPPSQLEKYTLYLDSVARESQEIVRAHFNNLSTDEVGQAIHAMRSFADLDDPLFGSYSRFYNREATTKDLATAFYPQNGFGYGKSYAHSEATPFGSIYKLVTAYEAIKQHKKKGAVDLNPLSLIDEYNLQSNTPQGIILGYTESGKQITRRYKGGRLPKSSSRIGKVDLPIAMERSSNIYFSLLAGDVIDDPKDLIRATEDFGFGHKTGIDLPREFKGLVPKDVCENKSALYSMAIGQHSLLATPLQATSFFATLANHGKRVQPQLVSMSVQSEAKTSQDRFSEPLKQIGIHFPLFLTTKNETKKFHIETFHPKQVGEIELETKMRDYLFDAMKRVFTGTRGSARPNAVRYLWGKPKVMRSYLEIKDDLIGKTSTAEFSYHPTLDRETPPILCTHTWFGTLSFERKKDEPLYDNPELAIIVYLQHGDWGKEGAPLTAQLISKWREIKKRQRT